MSGALGLYLHVPFCSRRCDYCDFYVVVGRESDRDPFVRRMAGRIRERARDLAPGELRADTIYLGGGTPSIRRAANVPQFARRQERPPASDGLPRRSRAQARRVGAVAARRSRGGHI